MYTNNDYWFPDPNYIRKESFLNFPNIPDKPAMVYIVYKEDWERCTTIKQTKKHSILVKLEDGTIYDVPRVRKDFVVPLLDYYDIVEVCRNCKFRHRAAHQECHTCNQTAEDIYMAFYTTMRKIDYVQDECSEREPLNPIQKWIDRHFGKPTDKQILEWKKWDSYIF